MRGMIRGMLDPFDPDSFIVRAEVHILGIEPKISRTLELPITLNLAQLHEVLQAAFGWTDSHLHHFNIGGLIYGAPEFDEDGLSDSRTFEATEVRMLDLHFPYDPEENPLTILYEYDFGDNWRHPPRTSRGGPCCKVSTSGQSPTPRARRPACSRCRPAAGAIVPLSFW